MNRFYGNKNGADLVADKNRALLFFKTAYIGLCISRPVIEVQC